MVDEGEVHGYLQLGSPRTRNNLQANDGFSNISPPVDHNGAIFVALTLAGIGFLLPYNSFIVAVDYFQSQYPGSTIVFDMSTIYILVAFLTVLANNLLVETFSLNTRINFGYFVSLATLIFVAVCEVWMQAFSSKSYAINLIAVSIVSVGCTLQQSSFYGYTSMLPSRYTQAVMTGESAAGLLVSTNRIMTKMMVPDQRNSTVAFFAASIVVVLACAILHQVVRRTDFVQFYITICRQSKTKIVLEPTEDAGLIDPSEIRYGELKLQSSPPPQSGSLSFANPAYEPTASAPTYKVEEVVIAGQSRSCGGIKGGLLARRDVISAIHPYMTSICLVYFGTLCLYPGIETEIISCRMGSWMPVLLMTVFNAADFFGKMIAVVSWRWTTRRLLICSVARLVLVPLMLMCAAPRSQPIVSSEIFALVLSLLLGLSNGVLGSVPMIQAPSKVADRHKELTGNIMTLSYNIGLTGGSLVAYLLDAVLGPMTKHPCEEGLLYDTTTSSLTTEPDLLYNITSAAINATM